MSIMPIGYSIENDTIYSKVDGQDKAIHSELDLIEDQHRLLCSFRDDGRQPSQALLDDIAAYASILSAFDSAARAREYMEAARGSGKPFSRKRPREVAREKGWIP